jgi:hypothetical protein
MSIFYACPCGGAWVFWGDKTSCIFFLVILEGKKHQKYSSARYLLYNQYLWHILRAPQYYSGQVLREGPHNVFLACRNLNAKSERWMAIAKL